MSKKLMIVIFEPRRFSFSSAGLIMGFYSKLVIEISIFHQKIHKLEKMCYIWHPKN